MKKNKIFYLLLSFFVFTQIAFAQTAMVKVGFQDGLIYFANQINRTDNTVTVAFLHSGAVYEFDNNGYILSSTGSYKIGERVNLITIQPYRESLYNRATMHSADPTIPNLEVAIMFADGKIYYGAVEASAEADWFSVRFYHSGSQYTMHREDGFWKVWSTDKGNYPPGYQLLDIIQLGEDEFFYFAS